MEEYIRVNQTALRVLRGGERIVLATVVRVCGSAPRHDGARMLVFSDGQIEGTVGGAELEQLVRKHAAEVFESRHSRIESYRMIPDDHPDSIGLCGGEVEVFLELLEPQPTLLIFGAGHVSQALSAIGAQIGFKVVVVDDRKEFVTAEKLPFAAEHGLIQYDAETGVVGKFPLEVSAPLYVIVATWGWDEPALQTIASLNPQPEYVGLIGSRTKARVIKERLLDGGSADEFVENIVSPVGLDLGAETPGEIALSIMAEILLVHKRATGKRLSKET